MKFLKPIGYCILALAVGVIVGLGLRAYVDNEAYADRYAELEGGTEVVSLDGYAGQPSPRIAFLDDGPYRQLYAVADDPPSTEPPVPTDPIDDPAGTIREVRDVYADLGIGAAVAYVLLVLGTVLHKRFPEARWYGWWDGRLGAVVSSGTALAGLAFVCFTGALPWAAFVGAMLVAAGGIVFPAPKPVKAVP